MAINASTVHNPTILDPRIYPIGLTVRKKIGGHKSNVINNCYGTYIFRTYGTKVFIYKYYYPYRPPSPTREAWESYYATGVSNWQGFSEATKNYYREKRYPKIMSGYNRYLRLYLLSMKQFVV